MECGVSINNSIIRLKQVYVNDGNGDNIWSSSEKNFENELLETAYKKVNG